MTTPWKLISILSTIAISAGCSSTAPKIGSSYPEPNGTWIEYKLIEDHYVRLGLSAFDFFDTKRHYCKYSNGVVEAIDFGQCRKTLRMFQDRPYWDHRSDPPI